MVEILQFVQNDKSAFHVLQTIKRRQINEPDIKRYESS
jgi:hypothetical protein